MSDVGLIIVERPSLSGRYQIDIDLDSAGMVDDTSLETAALVSLFSDQRCIADELPQFEENQRGWWGDLLSEVEGDQIGSKLWLLKREKTTSQTLQRFIDYSNDSLQWMLDDGIASDVQVDAEYISRGAIGVQIKIIKPSGLSEQFQIIWDGQEFKR